VLTDERASFPLEPNGAILSSDRNAELACAET
jgi:hypothetical protein